ncbi:MAG: hypothetical protein U0989_02610 [Azonexus sp.]|nr:hypothetical protein [Azonexus sp.]MDP3636985.1 hypothetical protein [Azonexus sp.]MDZ4313658.1 hypothetical protein [Azonexus sp.]
MSTAAITQQQATDMAKRLENLGMRLELDKSPDWYTVAKAAALLESIRLGLAAIEPPPVIFGFDMAAPGADITVQSTFHA